MEKKEYIKNRFKKILSENLESRADELMERIKLNLDKEVPFSKPGKSFDYVEEREICSECGGYKGRGEMMEKDMCECGSMNEEKEICSECGGYKGGDVMEGEMCECGSMNESLKGGQKKLDVAKPYGKLTRDDFDQLRKGVKKHMKEYTMGDDDLETVKPYGDFSTDSPKKIGKVKNVGDRFQRKVSKKFDDYELDEEMEEGNEFSGKLSKARKEGRKSFEVDGKTYPVKKNKVDETKYRIVSNGQSAIFTENEVIDMIENIVNEEKVKSNIKNQTVPKGYTEYERVHKEDKREEDKYFKDLAKKMTDYLKDSSDKGSKYEMKETEKFPTENGGLKKGNRKKYTPSDAVDEYIDAFSYPGMTNLVYDEIKPNDEWIEANMKGSSKTGNAQVDEDGNALGNVVPSKTGDKLFQNFKDNLYGQEQQDASYKRQPQPVDQAGEHTESGSLKSKRGRKTAQSVLNKLEESVSPKEKEKLSEEFTRMQTLIGYNHKTQ